MHAFLRPFEPEVARVIEAHAKKGAVACFDADWTLWNYDMGEAFLRWLLASGLIPGQPPGLALYQRYRRILREDRCRAYEYATTVMAGLRETDVNRWASALAALWPSYRPAMVGLLLGLRAIGVDCFVVSATCEFAVKAALRYVGFPAERVFGMKVRVEGGVLTDQLVPPGTCGQGKAEVIARHVARRPDLAFGDSLGDLEMLEAAKQPVVVALRDRLDHGLARVASSRGWPVLLVDPWR